MTTEQQDQLVSQLRMRAGHWRFRAALDEALAAALETHASLVSRGLLGVSQVEMMAEALWKAAQGDRTDVPA